jgi:hypothetical protein
MGRAMRQMGDTSVPYTETITSMQNKKDLNTWLGSIIEWLDLDDKTLYQAETSPSLLDTPIILDSPTKKVAEWIVDRDISTNGDLRQIDWDRQERDGEGYPKYTEDMKSINYSSAPIKDVLPIMAKI